MVAVVRAFDLHDHVAARRRACDADGVHRRFGTGVGEAHLVEPEAPAELLGERDGHLGRGGEVRARARGALDRLDDLRVGVPDDVAAEPAVEVDVLVAVDVPQVPAHAPRHVDRVRITGLEGRSHTEREVHLGPLEQGFDADVRSNKRARSAKAIFSALSASVSLTTSP